MTGDASALSAESLLALLLAPPLPLPRHLSADATYICHHTDAASLLAVAQLLLHQLAASIDAADRVTSFRKPNPAILRHELEQHLLTGTTT